MAEIVIGLICILAALLTILGLAGMVFGMVLIIKDLIEFMKAD